MKRNIKIEVQPDVGQEWQQGQTTDAKTQTQQKKLDYDKAFDKPPDK